MCIFFKHWTSIYLPSIFHTNTDFSSLRLEAFAASLIYILVANFHSQTGATGGLPVVRRTHVAAECQGGPCKVKAWNVSWGANPVRFFKSAAWGPHLGTRWRWCPEQLPDFLLIPKLHSCRLKMSAVTHWDKGYFNLVFFSNPSYRIIGVHIQTQVFSGCVANDEGVMWIKLWSLWSQHSELRCLDQPTNIGKNPGNEELFIYKKSGFGGWGIKVAVCTSWISTNPDDRCPCTVTLFWSP